MTRKMARLLSILLLLAVFASAAPASAAPSKEIASPPPPPVTIKMHTWIEGHTRAYISGTGFPKKHVYFVKMREGMNGVWYKLDTSVKPDASGKINQNFKLPASLRNAKRVQVCLKEVYHSYLVCDLADNK
jgi:hypothetical protein